MKMKTIALLLALLCLGTLFTGCEKEPEVTVSVQSVGLITGMGSVGLLDRYAGVVEAGRTVSVERDESMKIKELLVAAGDEVEEGQVLFTYDVEAISLEKDRKILELEQAKAGIATKTEQIAQLEKERDKAAESDKLDYTLQIQELQIDVTEAKLGLEAKEKDLERMDRYLENDQVLAPVSGRVQELNENGGYDDYGNPKPFLSIAETGVYRVKGNINEQNAASLMEGMPVTVRSRVDANQTWHGCVERVDWENPVKSGGGYYYYGIDDGGMTQPSKYPFYIALDSDEGLMLGQHVYIEPGEGQDGPEGLYLPSWCLNDADSNPWVWAENAQNKLEKRTLKLGDYDADRDAWLVLDGLTVNDFIAPPSEDCVEGAATVRYSEQDFEPVPPDGNYEGGFEGNYEGGFEGNYEGGFEDEPIYNGAIVEEGPVG